MGWLDEVIDRPYKITLKKIIRDVINHHQLCEITLKKIVRHVIKHAVISRVILL